MKNKLAMAQTQYPGKNFFYFTSTMARIHHQTLRPRPWRHVDNLIVALLQRNHIEFNRITSDPYIVSYICDNNYLYKVLNALFDRADLEALTLIHDTFRTLFIPKLVEWWAYHIPSAYRKFGNEFGYAFLTIPLRYYVEDNGEEEEDGSVLYIYTITAFWECMTTTTTAIHVTELARQIVQYMMNKRPNDNSPLILIARSYCSPVIRLGHHEYLRPDVCVFPNEIMRTMFDNLRTDNQSLLVVEAIQGLQLSSIKYLHEECRLRIPPKAILRTLERMVQHISIFFEAWEATDDISPISEMWTNVVKPIVMYFWDAACVADSCVCNADEQLEQIAAQSTHSSQTSSTLLANALIAYRRLGMTINTSIGNTNQQESFESMLITVASITPISYLTLQRMCAMDKHRMIPTSATIERAREMEMYMAHGERLFAIEEDIVNTWIGMVRSALFEDLRAFLPPLAYFRVTVIFTTPFLTLWKHLHHPKIAAFVMDALNFTGISDTDADRLLQRPTATQHPEQQSMISASSLRSLLTRSSTFQVAELVMRTYYDVFANKRMILSRTLRENGTVFAAYTRDRARTIVGLLRFYDIIGRRLPSHLMMGIFHSIHTPFPFETRAWEIFAAVVQQMGQNHRRHEQRTQPFMMNTLYMEGYNDGNINNDNQPICEIGNRAFREEWRTSTKHMLATIGSSSSTAAAVKENDDDEDIVNNDDHDSNNNNNNNSEEDDSDDDDSDDDIDDEMVVVDAVSNGLVQSIMVTCPIQ
jgi:hypothetical protein